MLLTLSITQYFLVLMALIQNVQSSSSLEKPKRTEEQVKRTYTWTAQSASKGYSWPPKTAVRPDREQWNANDGYCGEISLQMAGLSYGQWYSQYTIREVLSKKQSDLHDPDKPLPQQQQLLIGINDETTANAFSIRSTTFLGNTPNFLAWVKTNVRKGYSVSIGLYVSQGKEGAAGGNLEYDHIVSVSSVKSNYDDDVAHPDDIMTIDDHYMSTELHYRFDDKNFITSREGCNANADQGGKLDYCLLDTSTTNHEINNYGVAYEGPVDKPEFPVSIKASLFTEGGQDAMTSCTPETEAHGGCDPPAVLKKKQTLTATISGLKKGTRYILVRFSRWNKKGTEQPQNFKKIEDAVVQYTFIAEGATETYKYVAALGDSVIFRVYKVKVPATAKLADLAHTAGSYLRGASAHMQSIATQAVARIKAATA